MMSLVVLTISCFIVGGDAQHTLDTDRDVLLSIQFIDGQDLGWDENTDVCSWDRVTCENERVTELDLSAPCCGQNPRLTTLPESFGQLTALTFLDLSRNRLTTLPESFYNIHNLTGFYFDNTLVPCPKLRIPRGGGGNSLMYDLPFECVCERNYYDTTHGEIHCFNADNRFASSEMI
eukprot:SAG11_NODE_14163_length_622_cov_10.191205_1_plen_176_part_01